MDGLWSLLFGVLILLAILFVGVAVGLVLARRKKISGVSSQQDQANNLKAALREQQTALEKVIAERDSALEGLQLRHRAVEATSAGITVVDARAPGSPMSFVNSAFSNMTGYEPEEVIGRDGFFLEGPLTDQASALAIRQAISEGNEVEVTLLTYRKDGSTFWNRLHISPVRDHDGRITHFLGIHTDVTEVKAHEQELQLSQEILNKVGSLVLIANGRGEITYASPSVREVLGYEPEDILGDGWWCLTSDDENVRTAALSYVRAAANGRVLIASDSYERMVKTKSGEERCILWQDARGPGDLLISVGQDITARKLAEQVQVANSRRLSQLVAVQSEITAAVGDHENLMQLIVERTQSLIGGMGTVILVPDGDDMVFTTTSGALATDAGARLPINSTVIGHCYLSGEVSYFNDMPSDPLVSNDPLTLLGLRSVMLAPLQTGNKIIGVLGVGALERNAFSDHDVSTLQLFAGFLGAALEQDATIKSKSELLAALAESEERFQLAARATDDVLWDWNLLTNEVWRNESSFNRFGYQDDYLYRNWVTLVHPEDLPDFYQSIAAASEGQGHYWSDEYRLLRADGGYSHILARGYLTRDAAGKALRMIGSEVDITKRRAWEEGLQQLAAIVESSLDAIVSCALDGTILSWNPSAERLYGYSAHDVVGKNIAIIWPPELMQGWINRLARLPSGERLEHREITQITSDGRQVPILQTISPVRNEAGLVVALAGIARDITIIKRAEETRRAKEAAELSNHAKNAFLARMSHELRTPLNAILGFSHLLSLDELNDEQRESMNYILQAGDHLLRLVNEVLDVSRMENGQLDMNVEPLSPRPILVESTDLIRPLALARNLKLHAQIDGLGSLEVMADGGRLRQVLMSLLTNAVKFNRDGGSISLSTSLAGSNRLRIEVRDSGLGLTADQLNLLFTPFERLGAERYGVEGTGLGLVLAKLLVEEMGGSIGVASTPDVGSTFWIELPLAMEVATARRELVTQPGAQARLASR